MQSVLIFGAGLVANPIVQHLLDHGFNVTLADRDIDHAKEKIHHHPNGKSLKWCVGDTKTRDELIASHDLVVSLLPPRFHPIIAKACIALKTNMVTTSYVSPEMKELDQAAKDAGIIILNELGVDPGLDHMSAKRIIDLVHEKNGKIIEFYSITGALPSPENYDNPMHYKFSWSPKGVIKASKNDAEYLKDGKEVFIPTVDLFKNPWKQNFPDIGELEIYPNRDSLDYIDTYCIPEVQTILRGTFRHPGWCDTLDAFKKLELMSYDEQDFTDITYADFIRMQSGINTQENLKQLVAEKLGLKESDIALQSLEWLGFFEEKPMNKKVTSPFEITSDLMIEKMELAPHEKDMIVMQHTFLVEYKDGKQEVIKSRIIEYGTPATDTAISRTVALPAAIGAEMILHNEIKIKGVHIPVLPQIYNPVLDRLEELDIKMIEEFGLDVSANPF